MTQTHSLQILPATSTIDTSFDTTLVSVEHGQHPKRCLANILVAGIPSEPYGNIVIRQAINAEFGVNPQNIQWPVYQAQCRRQEQSWTVGQL
jgi:hypothetical protein